MSTLTGIDVLDRADFHALQGQRVGLITNHTGLTRDGRSTIDVLHQAPGVTLVALFGPEHGIRGEFDAPVRDSVDARTGMPVYSLYGDTMRPQPAQLRGLDALVFDIQDVGCRFYTYTATLRYSMEEAARQGIHFVVLDRPNPIGGTLVEGPVADADRLSFVASHAVPVRYGMTLGELARMDNVERKIGAGLIVVPCEGWRRSDWWDATGLTWVNPSPNMRSLTEAALYPGVGLLEFTNVSVGRGTDTPFEVIGAPWIDYAGQMRLADRLNGRRLPGARFVPVRFTPRSSKFAGESCGGVNIVITDRARFRALPTGLELAVALRALFPAAWEPDHYDRLLVNRVAYEAIAAGADGAEIEARSRAGIDAFLRVRRRYLLYGEAEQTE